MKSDCFLDIGLRINPKYKKTTEGYEFKCQYKIGKDWTDSQARILIPLNRLKDFQKILKENYAH